MDFNAIAKIIADRTSCDVSSMKSKSTFTEPVIDSLNIVDQLKNLEGELNEFIRDDMKTSPLVSNSNHCFLCQTVPSYRKSSLIQLNFVLEYLNLNHNCGVLCVI